MRTVEIRRHSFTKKGDARGRGSHLSNEGVTAARNLGASFDRFDYVLASTSPRTTETAIAMGVAVDDLIEMPSPVETGEIEFHSWRDWDDPFTTLQQKARDSAAVESYMTLQAERLMAATDVADSGTTLVIGHGGWIESVVAALVGPVTAPQLGGSFWHLDGIRLVIESAASVVVESVARHPRSVTPQVEQ
jgi:broad specificity phosphatase PhoE